MLFCKPNQKNTTSFVGGYPFHVKLRCGFEEWINLKTALELVQLLRISYVEIRNSSKHRKARFPISTVVYRLIFGWPYTELLPPTLLAALPLEK